MCISKSGEDTAGWKCCFCFSLTIGTFIIGLFNIAACIIALVGHFWIEASIWGVFSLPYVMMIFMSSSAGLRKCIYILELIAYIIAMVIYLIGSFVVWAHWGSIID